MYFAELYMAFIVEGSPNDYICYKVDRAKCECKHDKVNTVTIETFHSKTSAWYYSMLICSSTLSLGPWKAATVIRGVIHWFAMRGNIAIYDQEHEERHINLIELPGSYDFDERVLGESSNGLLQYGKSCKPGMEICVLDKEQEICSSSTKWILRYKLNFKTMWKKNPRVMTVFSTCSKSKETQILSLLPQNSGSVFIRSGDNIFICHIENREVEVVQCDASSSSILWDFGKVVPYYKPAWPHSSLCHS